MKFKNRHNIAHNIGDRIVWESRSVAVVGVIFIMKGNMGYVLVSRRGPKAADFQGKMNLIAGYLDWDETGTDAVIRETWEETGFNIKDAIKKYKTLNLNLYEPWAVSTNINENRQNISLRYGLVFELKENEDFPILTTKHNEIDGESEDPMWLPLSDIDKYEWAFRHNYVINSYILKLI